MKTQFSGLDKHEQNITKKRVGLSDIFYVPSGNVVGAVDKDKKVFFINTVLIKKYKNVDINYPKGIPFCTAQTNIGAGTIISSFWGSSQAKSTYLWWNWGLGRLIGAYLVEFDKNKLIAESEKYKNRKEISAKDSVSRQHCVIGKRSLSLGSVNVGKIISEEEGENEQSLEEIKIKNSEFISSIYKSNYFLKTFKVPPHSEKATYTYINFESFMPTWNFLLGSIGSTIYNETLFQEGQNSYKSAIIKGSYHRSLISFPFDVKGIEPFIFTLLKEPEALNKFPKYNRPMCFIFPTLSFITTFGGNLSIGFPFLLYPSIGGIVISQAEPSFATFYDFVLTNKGTNFSSVSYGSSFLVTSNIRDSLASVTPYPPYFVISETNFGFFINKWELENDEKNYQKGTFISHYLQNREDNKPYFDVFPLQNNVLPEEYLYLDGLNFIRYNFQYQNYEGENVFEPKTQNVQDIATILFGAVESEIVYPEGEKNGEEICKLKDDIFISLPIYEVSENDMPYITINQPILKTCNLLPDFYENKPMRGSKFDENQVIFKKSKATQPLYLEENLWTQYPLLFCFGGEQNFYDNMFDNLIDLFVNKIKQKIELISEYSFTFNSFSIANFINEKDDFLFMAKEYQYIRNNSGRFPTIRPKDENNKHRSEIFKKFIGKEGDYKFEIFKTEFDISFKLKFHNSLPKNIESLNSISFTRLPLGTRNRTLGVLLVTSTNSTGTYDSYIPVELEFLKFKPQSVDKIFEKTFSGNYPCPKLIRKTEITLNNVLFFYNDDTIFKLNTETLELKEKKLCFNYFQDKEIKHCIISNFEEIIKSIF